MKIEHDPKDRLPDLLATKKIARGGKFVVPTQAERELLMGGIKDRVGKEVLQDPEGGQRICSTECNGDCICSCRCDD